MFKIQFKRLSPQARTPEKMSTHAAGYDLSADLQTEIVLSPGNRILVPTGIAIALPLGFEAQIRPRSGLAIKYGIGILNSPGTIDADYRGEIKVILFNISEEDFVITPGMRIAQMVISEVPETVLTEQEALTETEREAGGFGHTGYK
jgi:dUTP pyrophosphatase